MFGVIVLPEAYVQLLAMMEVSWYGKEAAIICPMCLITIAPCNISLVYISR